jgi:hypothetical protein
LKGTYPIIYNLYGQIASTFVDYKIVESLKGLAYNLTESKFDFAAFI